MHCFKIYSAFLFAIMVATACQTMDKKTDNKEKETCQRCVDFEPPLSLGSKYGSSAGHHSGDVIFTSNGIKVSVFDFQFLTGASTFGNAEIKMPPIPFGLNQTMSTNNINLRFDFTSIGFVSKQVQFEFMDQGGMQNLSVNGSPIFAGRLGSAPATIAGVTISVYTTAGTPIKGMVVLTGKVKELTIGGQEFWLDNICVK